MQRLSEVNIYVRRNLTNEYWEKEFKSHAEAIGMDYLAKVVTKMCRKYLGLSEDYTWCDDADDELIDDLCTYILEKGNFGTKIDKESRTTIGISHHFKNPVSLFRYLTKAGMTHMEEKGLKPIKAFAWIYQIFRLIKKTFSLKKKSNLAKEIQIGVKEADLLNRLKVTRI